MDWIGSSRERKQGTYWPSGVCLPRKNRMRVRWASVSELGFRLNHESANNGFYVIRKLKRLLQLCTNILSDSFLRIGKRFTQSGSRTFKTGVSAAKSGGDTGYP